MKKDITKNKGNSNKNINHAPTKKNEFEIYYL